MSEALDRLKQAVAGREAIDQRVQGKRAFEVAFCEVASADILEIAATVASPSGRVRALIQGNQGAAEGSWVVHCKVTDVLHLIQSAPEPEPTRGQPSVNDE